MSFLMVIIEKRNFNVRFVFDNISEYNRFLSSKVSPSWGEVQDSTDGHLKVLGLHFGKHSYDWYIETHFSKNETWYIGL